MEDSKALVNQGMSGTGAAVVYDTNHFNPVKFSEDLAAQIRKEKAVKIAEREKKNAAAQKALTETILPEDGLFQDEFVAMNKAWKDKALQDPTIIYDIFDPTKPLGKEFMEQKTQILAEKRKADDISERIKKDIAIASAKDARKVLSPRTYDNLEKVKKMGYKDAISFYDSLGGTAIEPAADIEDLMSQMKLQPQNYDTRISGGKSITTPTFDPQEQDTEITAIITNPANERLVADLVSEYGSEEKLVEELKRRATPKDIITNAPSTGGHSGGGTSVYKNVMSNFYHNDKGDFSVDGEINAVKLSSNGKTLQPYTYTDDNGNPIFMQAVEVRKVGDSYKIFGNEALRTNEQKMTVEEATARGFDPSEMVETGETDADGKKYVQIVELKPTEVWLNPSNTAALKAQTGKDYWEEFKKRNNFAGKNGNAYRGESAKAQVKAEEDALKAAVRELEKKIANTPSGVELAALKVQKKDADLRLSSFDREKRLKEIASGKTTQKTQGSKPNKWEANRRK